ncbi:MAG TPA: hypothetical protein PLV91_03350 [Verrucomicrobiota bacterium]|nr:hypothetical protein [Verrucomicrobiota bacterium]
MPDSEIIREIEVYDATPREVSLKRRDDRLRGLLRHAKEHSPYLSKLYRDIDPENFSLNELPIQERAILEENFEEWVTDPAIRKADAKAFLADPENMGIPFLEKYSLVTTSGTSGAPLIVVRDELHQTVHRAFRQKRLLGRIPPELFRPDLNRIAVILQQNAPSANFISFLRLKRLFPEESENILGLSTIDPIPELVRKLNEFQPATLCGYSSLLGLLALEQIHGRLQITPSLILSTAEHLTGVTVTTLRSAFNDCTVLNDYCAAEGGEIAMTCPCGKLHVNEDWIILEPVDEDDRPISPMEISDSVLVTDLSNFVQPIIRYRLDDRVQKMSKPCRCGSKRQMITVHGRESDVVIFENILLPSIVFTTLMNDLPGVLSYQFAQTRRNRLEFRAVYPDETDREAFFSVLSEKVSEILRGNGCHNVEFIASDTLPKSSTQGGKLKSVISEIWQNYGEEEE